MGSGAGRFRGVGAARQTRVGSDRLVGDDQRRVVDEGPGDGDPLLLARLLTTLSTGCCDRDVHRLWMIALTPILRRVLRSALVGRRVDRDPPAATGPTRRLTREDCDRILAATTRWYTRLVPTARLDRIPTRGNRLNVRLAVLTIALYRSLIDDGLRPDRAADLMGDVGWRVYEGMARPLTLVARVRHREPHRRMSLSLRLLLRFPFSSPGRPGYEVDVTDTGNAVLTTWTWCPPQTFVRDLIEAEGDRGELEAFRRSWCTYDWQFNDLLAGGRGAYEREHTLSYGDDRCDMRWAVAGPPTSGSRRETTTPVTVLQSDE